MINMVQLKHIMGQLVSQWLNHLSPQQWELWVHISALTSLSLSVTPVYNLAVFIFNTLVSSTLCVCGGDVRENEWMVIIWLMVNEFVRCNGCFLIRVCSRDFMQVFEANLVGGVRCYINKLKNIIVEARHPVLN